MCSNFFPVKRVEFNQGVSKLEISCIFNKITLSVEHNGFYRFYEVDLDEGNTSTFLDSFRKIANNSEEIEEYGLVCEIYYDEHKAVVISTYGEFSIIAFLENSLPVDVFEIKLTKVKEILEVFKG